MRTKPISAVVGALLISLAGFQSVASAQSASSVPRTPWGDPDLQGHVDEQEPSSACRSSGPQNSATARTLTDEEFAQARRRPGHSETDNADSTSRPPTGRRRGSGLGDVAAAALARARQGVAAHVVGHRSAGRPVPPPMRSSAPRPRSARRADGSFSNAAFNGPQDLSLWERCITRGLPGAMFPDGLQRQRAHRAGAGVVAITYEMIHDTRVIPTDGRPVGAAIRGYFGDSRGRWEGDTLVVDVTNFSDKTYYRGSRDTLHLTERFTRVGRRACATR